MKKRKQFRTRTSGTARQVGNVFPIEGSSMQSRKAGLPKYSDDRKNRVSKILREKFEQEEKNKRKRLKELSEQKKHGRRMFDVPVPNLEKEEPSEAELLDEEIKEDIDNLHEEGVTAVVFVKKEVAHPLSQALGNNRIVQSIKRRWEGYRDKKQEEYRKKHPKVGY